MLAARSVARGGPALAFIKIVLVVRGVYLLECKCLAMLSCSVGRRGKFTQLDAGARYAGQLADERLATVTRHMGPHFHFLSDELLEMFQLVERQIYSRRRHLQQVAALDRVVDIQKVAQHRTQPLQIIERDAAAWLIDQQPQHRAARSLFELHRYQVKSLALEMRLDEVRNLARHRMQFQHYHRSTPTPEFRVPNKKVGTSPLVAY